MERMNQLKQQLEDNPIFQYKLNRMEQMKNKDRLQMLSELSVNNARLAYQLERYHRGQSQGNPPVK